MADIFSKEKRSAIMSRVRGRDTAPEVWVRRLLWSHGYRYRLHVRSLPGRPDVYVPRLRTAVLINGCFWHGHSNCRRAALPTSNILFWKAKILRNVERDRENRRDLRKLGISSIVIWTCQLKRPHAVEKRLLAFLRSK